MEFVYCEGLSNAQPEINSFKVKENEKISKGDPVSLNQDNCILKSINLDFPVGVAAEDYPKSDEIGIMPARDKIKVITASNAVYRVYGIKMTFESTSTKSEFHTTTYYESGYYDQCILVLMSKGEGSENTDEIGSVRYVDSSYWDGDKYVLYLSGSGSAPHPDDVYAILPAIGSTRIKSGNGSSFSLTGNGGIFRCIGHDLSTNNANGVPSCFIKLINHVSTKTNSY